MSTPEDEWPSDEVLRIVYAFGDAGRKARVRLLAERVRANEDALRSARLQLEAAKMAERDARLATHRAEAAEAALRELSASAVQRVRDLERERDAALARVQELEGALQGVLRRHPHRGSCCTFDAAGKTVVTPQSCRCAPWEREARAVAERWPTPSVSTPRLRRGDVVRVKGSALVEIRYRLGDVLDVSGGEVLVNVATAQGPQRHWLFVEQVESTGSGDHG